MAKAHYLTDKDGSKFYPFSHAGASYTTGGTTVQAELDGLGDAAKKTVTNSIADNTNIPTASAVKTYVDEALSSKSSYLGTVNALSELSTTAIKGSFYRVATAWDGVHVSDVIIAEKNNPAQTIDGENWSTLHNESDTDTTYTLSQDNVDGHKIILTPSNGTAQTITVPDTDTWRPVVDNLTTNSADSSLSAKQGKILNETKKTVIDTTVADFEQTFEDAQDGDWILVTDEEISDIPAANAIPYDNSQSGITADDVQGAIDEINAKSESLPDNIVLAKDESTPSTPAPRDADTLGGQLPSYYATNASLMQIGNVELIMNTQKLTTGNSYPLSTKATNYKELYFVFSSTADNNALFEVKRIHTLFAIGASNRLSGRYDVAEGISSNYQIGISTNGQALSCAYASNSNPSFELMLSIYGCL